MGGALPFRAVGGGVPAVRPAVELEDHVRERRAESPPLLRLKSDLHPYSEKTQR